MKVTLSKVLDLKRIYDIINAQTLPAKTAYKFSKFFETVLQESNFYSTELNKIIDKYAQKDERGYPLPTSDKTGIQLQPEYTEIATKKVQELLDLEVNLSDTKFTLEELDAVKLSIADFNILLPFISE